MLHGSASCRIAESTGRVLFLVADTARFDTLATHKQCPLLLVPPHTTLLPPHKLLTMHTTGPEQMYWTRAG